jgi:peptidoglycan-N-acetylglucosamine deacetylase
LRYIVLRFIYKPPYFLRKFYPKAIWRINGDEKSIFLTFDDGPIPEITPWILDLLKLNGLKATFFCVGDNVSRYPEIYKRIISEGHQVGNHTNNHLNGWKTRLDEYLKNISVAENKIRSSLFRPPYGRLTKKQYKFLSKQYKIVFWDVLTHDYNVSIKPEKCLENALKYTRDGSIIVFHDNIKSINTVKFVLPRYIEHFLKLNYKFVAIDSLPIS